MRTTLLLDIDETLLHNRMDSFLPAYLQAWADFITPYTDPQRFVKAMLDGTRLIAEHERPECTLRDTFDSVFYSSIGYGKADFRPLEDQFYRQVFPTLKSICQPVPGAVDFVNASFERGYQIAIATNPFFPLTAIEQRLDWAGLPVDQYPFALIPSIESFHFAKPNTAFFAEAIANLGWPDGRVIMVGDDPKMDIHPADQFGLFTFWCVNQNQDPPENLQMPHASGSLNDLLNWIDQFTDSNLQPDFSTPTALLATLRSTPAVLKTISTNFTDNQWTCHPQTGEWCAAEIICHLRDVDIEVNLPRLVKMLREDNPFIPGMDTDRWNEERQYHLQDGPEAMNSFMVGRMKLLSLLDSVQPEGWQRTARHSIFGRTDLSELVGIIAGHDRLHIQQFLANLKLFPD